MSFDFPSSPSENQTYTPAGGPTYIFKSPRWMVQGVPGGLADAPNDGKPYVRKSLLWDDFTDDMALKENTANKGAVSGYAPLDASQKVPAINLPAYVDDVVEYANLAAFPGTGAVGIIYVALDTNKVYRWTGSVYVEISPSPGSTDAVPEGSTNLYYTTARATSAAIAAIPPATVAPLMDGVAAVGTVAKYAKEDHKHPSDTTKLDTASATPPATVAPLMDGVAAVGVTTKYAREDHKHPTDTTLAPLASPPLTGTPTAPTATAGTSTTQLATTAFVTTADALKADLASPTFTGDPKAPTATAGDSDTSIATTAFVQTAVAVAKVTLSDTAPGSPVVGSLWYETDTGVLLIYYNDGTSTQWVQIAGSTA